MGCIFETPLFVFLPSREVSQSPMREYMSIESLPREARTRMKFDSPIAEQARRKASAVTLLKTDGCLSVVSRK